jgi:ubiquitin carboxyl-terminal hydrolase L5
MVVAKPAIESRMQRYASSETAFALLTLRPKRSTLLENEISSLEERLQEISLVEDEDEDVKEVATEIRGRIAELKGRLDYEWSNLERQRQENIRRRHNYFPFVLTLLKHLSKRNLLQPMIDRAVERQSAQPNAKRPKFDS